MSHRKLLAGVAMVAALGAGATVGLFLGVPGLSGAQTPTPSSSASPSPGGGHRGPGFGVGLIKGVGKADAFDGRLLDAVHVLGGGDAADFEDRR